jgi:hypothetical protein
MLDSRLTLSRAAGSKFIPACRKRGQRRIKFTALRRLVNYCAFWKNWGFCSILSLLRSKLNATLTLNKLQSRQLGALAASRSSRLDEEQPGACPPSQPVLISVQCYGLSCLPPPVNLQSWEYDL